MADDIACVIFLFLWRHHIRCRLIGGHLIIAMSQVVDRGDAVAAIRIDLLTVDGRGLQLSVFCDDESHAMAHTFTAYRSHLLEEFLHLTAGKRQVSDMVLKGRHIENIAVSHLPGRQRSTDAANVIHTEVDMLTSLLAIPHEDVGQQVAHITLRTVARHIVRCRTRNRVHHRVHDMFIRSQQCRSGLIRLTVIATVDQHLRALNISQMVWTAARRQQQHPRQAQRRQRSISFHDAII